MGERWEERVDALLAQGKPWRAKEVLRGNLGTAGYDRALYRRYAELLLDLGEEMEAGKYFWLAGVEGARAGAAMEVYLSRQRRLTGLQLYYDLPSSARVESWELYPDSVGRELRERGLSRLPRRKNRAAERGAGELPQWVIAGCLVVGVFLVVCVIVGLIEIVRGVVGLV